MPVSSSLHAHADQSIFYLGAEPFGRPSLTVTPTKVIAVADDGAREEIDLRDVFQASAAATFDFRERRLQRWDRALLAVTGLFGGPTTLYTYRGRFLVYVVNLGDRSIGRTLGELGPQAPPRWWARAITTTFEYYGHARRLDILATESFGVIEDLERCRSWSGGIASMRAHRAVRSRLRASRAG